MRLNPKGAHGKLKASIASLSELLSGEILFRHPQVKPRLCRGHVDTLAESPSVHAVSLNRWLRELGLHEQVAGPRQCP